MIPLIPFVLFRAAHVKARPWLSFDTFPLISLVHTLKLFDSGREFFFRASFIPLAVTSFVDCAPIPRTPILLLFRPPLRRGFMLPFLCCPIWYFLLLPPRLMLGFTILSAFRAFTHGAAPFPF